MPLDDYLLGLVLFAVTVGCVAGAGALIVRRRLDYLSGVPAALAFAIVATALLVLVHLLPGLFGLLSRASVLLLAVGALVAAARLPGEEPVRAGPGPAPRAGGGPVSWALAALALAMLLAASAAGLWSDAVTPSSDVDTLTFHLPNIAGWIQSGTFWRVDQFTPLLANGNYPHNGDVVFLSAVMPWDNDAFVRAWGLPFAAVAGLSVYAIAVHLGAFRATAVLFAVVFSSVPVLLTSSHEGAKTDSVMLACFGAGLYFLVRHLGSDRRSDLVLAGIGLGLAFGTKWYGVSSVVAVVALWVGVWLWRRRPVGALARNLGVLTGAIALAGAFWLVRNWVESGNPVNPTSVSLGGLTLFDAPRDYVRECGGYAVADYLTQAGIWRDYIVPAYRATYGLPGLFLAAGWVAGALVVIRDLWRRRSRRGADPAPVFLCLGVVLLAAVYSITPYSALGLRDMPIAVGANTRWLLPAALAAAALGAWAVSRTRARRPAEVLAVLAIADGVRRGFIDPAVEVLLAGLVLGLAAAALYAAFRLARRAGLRGRLAMAPAAALGLLALVAAGHERQGAFNEHRYRSPDLTTSWFAEQARSGHRVGLAGVWGPDTLSPVLPAFGPRLGNEVRFVGPTVRGQLRDYQTRSSFLAAVERGRYDLLLVGTDTVKECELPGDPYAPNEWARSAGFERLAENGKLVLYRVPRGAGTAG